MKTLVRIDTANNKEIIVGLTIDGKEDTLHQQIDKRRAQVVLPMIETLLKKHALSFKDITAIEVNPGPGSFTGLRVGITIANTLSYLLKVSVNNKPVGEFVEAVYS